MARALFFNIPSHGHTNPTLAYVRELVDRGDEITYYSVDALREDIEATGAIFRSYGEALPRDPSEVPTNLCQLALWVMEDSRRILPEALDFARSYQPDYIIHDAVSFWGRSLAHILELPAIASVTTFAFCARNMIASKRFALDLVKMISLGIPDLLKCRRVARELNERYGLPMPGVSGILNNCEDLSLVFTSPEFQPHAEVFDDRFKFVGPSISPRGGSNGFPWGDLSDRPLVYISLGTILTDRPAFFRNCLQALGKMDVQVVMSIGSKMDHAALGEVPSNCMLVEYVPQLEILERTSVFVTHGGMNSVSEGLYYGVPLVVVPQTAEQALVSRQVERLGAGAGLKMAKASADVLEGAVRRMLTETRYRERAVSVGGDLKAAGGYLRAVEETETFKKARGILS
jgi:MGT family glycosyltransferase